MPSEFKDKRIIVTGATRGLGRAVALGFAREGARVAASYSADEGSAARLAEELQALAADFLLRRSDVSSPADVQALVADVLAAWGHVDILVANAGIIRDKMLLFLGEEDWDRVLDVNLKGVYLCSRAVLKPMISRRWGRIITFTSPSALTGRPAQTNYAASKGGIISFTKALSKETARLGITVNAVCPGVIETPMTQGLDQKTRSGLLDMIAMGSFGTPEDIVNAVFFLASEKSGYITGQVLGVDGGLT